MEDRNLIKAEALQKLFGESPRDQFKKEEQFGKRLYITAWAVEILAALLGLCIAFFMAYDAYYTSEDKDFSTTINAILGALPFILIAIIEPTKIPLAGGLYRVKQKGWRLLILFALLALTAVTFETIFTGLERQLTNVTSRITKGENIITTLEQKNYELEKQIEEIENLDSSVATKDLEAKRENNNKQLNIELENLEKGRAEFENNKVSEKEALLQQLEDLQKAENNSILEATQTFKERVVQIDQEIENADKEKQSLREQLNASSGSNNPEIEALNEKIASIEQEVKFTQRQLNSREEERIRDAQSIIGVTPDGKTGPNTISTFNKYKQDREQEIRGILEKISEKSSILEQQNTSRIATINQKIDEIDENIRKLKVERSEQQENISRIRENERGSRNESARQRINDQINAKDTDIERKNTEVTEEKKKVRAYREGLDKEFQQQIKMITDGIVGKEGAIPKKMTEVEGNNERINEIKEKIRVYAEQSQIFRFAQMWSGHEDILDVTEKELAWVGFIWFGSIALICATVGTMLALISFIMTDQQAFLEKAERKLNTPIRRSTRRLLIGLRKRINRQVSTPIGRSFRLMLLSLRRRINKPRKVEVPVEVEKVVEVEKIVEKEVEVIKEVEVPVEKIVEVEKEVIKEVPVDKVAIKEIPVEVVRKELVHVPFYATEHGVVDATSILNNDPKPVLPLSKENKREEDDTIEGEFQSQISPNVSASSTEQNLTKKDSPTPKKTQTRKKVAGTTTKKATAKTARNKKS